MIDFINDFMVEYNNFVYRWGSEFPSMYTFIFLN